MITQWYDIKSLYQVYGDSASFDNTFKKSLISFINVFNINVDINQLDYDNIRFLR